MKTIDKSNNLPIEIVFNEIMEIYNSISIFASLDISKTKYRKINLRIVLFIVSGFLLLCTFIMSILDMTQLLPAIKPYMSIADAFLIIACILMLLNIFLYEHKLKKELQAITGVAVKNINSYVLFYTKCSNVNLEKLDLCNEYCDLLISKNTFENTQNISSYILWYALPFLINILSSWIGSDFSKDTTIINIINSMLWGLMGIMVYKLINIIKNKDTNIIKVLKLHVQYCIINKRSKT